MNLSRPRQGRGRAAGAAALLLTASVVGCGIRTTDVPVDGGPAPTRATCDAPAEDRAGAEVFLLCGSQVESVRRAVELRGGDPGQVAQALLAELQSDPTKEEQAVGFGTDVPSDLNVSSPPGETDGAVPVLRLSRGPGDLPLSALFQIVCTFAHSEALGNGQSVMLGGPPGSSTETPKEYPCTAAARAIPAEGAHQHVPGPPPGQAQGAGQGAGQGQDQTDANAGAESGAGAGLGEEAQDPTG